ncbi:MAG: hypothetical protein R3E79_02630 [Caldilineaceae bacterium]
MSDYSTYPIKELLARWARGDLTAEQAIGHLCQQVAALLQRLAALEARLNQLERRPPTQP